ncbi:predicted protein [Enterococcus casseliflavus EC30]|nr:predicted protein [Enterococcus casseliflavus EC30]EEV35515.1 predicted protein [Enterococcus casseliflavus EC10]
MGGMNMTTSIYRTVTNEIVKGEIIKSKSQQDMLIIQDKEGYFHVVEPIPVTTAMTPRTTKD